MIVALKVTYKGEDIIDETSDCSKILKTEGKYLEDNITIDYSGVAPPTLISKSITKNGNYNAVGDSADGYSSVSVNVPVGDPWDKFDELVGTYQNNTYYYGVLRYIKRDYMAGIPIGATSGSFQFLYSALEFFSCKNHIDKYIYIEIGTMRAATALKYFRISNIDLVMTNAFTACRNLKSLIIINNGTIANLQNTNAFGGGSSISSGSGYVYVNDSLVNDYKTATNWATYATQIKGFSEAPAYDNTATYEIGDVCKYNDKFYGYCKSDLTTSTGNAPTGTTDDNTYWEYVADLEV